MKKFLSIIFVMIFATSLFALSAITAKDIVKKAENMYKGKAEKVKDMTMIQTTNIDIRGQKMTTKQTIYKKGDKSKVESVIYMGENKMESSVINDGENIYVISMGQVQTMPNDKSKNNGIEDSFWWKEAGDSLKLVGEEKVKGINCYVLEYIGGAEKGNKIWVDKEKYLIRKAITTDEQLGGTMGGPIEMYFEEYKNIKNMVDIPFLVTAYLNGNKVIETKTENVKVNTGLSDDIFAAPKQEKKSSLEDMMRQMQQGEGK